MPEEPRTLSIPVAVVAALITAALSALTTGGIVVTTRGAPSDAAVTVTDFRLLEQRVEFIEARTVNDMGQIRDRLGKIEVLLDGIDRRGGTPELPR